MSFGIQVAGGTGAGRKRPLRDKPQEWNCRCADAISETAQVLRRQPGYLARCSDCGTARDGKR